MREVTHKDKFLEHLLKEQIMKIFHKYALS